MRESLDSGSGLLLLLPGVDFLPERGYRCAVDLLKRLDKAGHFGIP